MTTPKTRFDALVEHAPDAIVVADAGGVIRVWNPAAATLFGVAKEAAVGMRLVDFVPGAPDASTETPLELTGRHASGSRFPVELTLSRWSDGKTTQLTAFIRKASDNLFRTLAETLPQIAWMTDDQAHGIFYNSQWFAYTGTTPETTDGQDWLKAIHPDDLATIYRELAACVREHRTFEAQFRMRRADGSYRWFLGRSVCITHPGTGKELRIGTATDIHEQREAQETIIALKQRTDSLIQDAPILLWAVDADGTFTYYDGKVRTALGIRTEDRIGANILALYEGRPEIAGNVRRALMGEVVIDESIVNGVCLENKFTPQYDAHGKINGVIGLSVDVTQRKHAEQGRVEAAGAAQAALEASKLKSQFLATMSHEIRTPINGVLGMTGLLSDTALDVEQREYLQALQKSGESLLSLVNDLLDFSKIEAGRLAFEETPFTLADVFDDLDKATRFTAHAKRLGFDIELEKDLPQNLAGDGGRFRQVLLNLVGNAIKFTKEGAVHVRCSLSSQHAAGCVLRISVTDTGIGIPARTLRTLFTPFTQADASTARRYGGSGLGLSICKGIVERMGGQIGAVSTEGQGSLFWFTCPFRFAQPELEQPSADTSAPTLPPGLTARILVAEDNQVNQTIVVRMLEKHGLRADVVANGREAIAALESLPYDLVLMDCQMPEMDGYQATRLIRKSTRIPNRDLPIIAVTAHAMQGDAERCLEAGMTDYVTKPVKHAQLLRVLAKYLTPAAKVRAAG